MKNKKVIICSIFLVCVVLVVGGVCLFRPQNDKVKKGNEIYGKTYCEENHRGEMAGMAITKWSCKLCGKLDEHSNTNTPELCSDCASATNRCEQCGKLLKK